VLAQQTEDYHTANGQCGRREIEPEVWFRCLVRGMQVIFSRYDSQRVDAIGVTGQMHTLVTLDEAGNPVRPAILWNDLRAKELIPEMREIICREPDGASIAKTLSTGSPAANLYWMRRFEPENFRRIKKFLIAPDYLVYRLTGTCGTDYSGASTSCLYDIQRRRWSDFMRGFLGLHEEVYPQVRGSCTAAGTLTEKAARPFSMRKDVAVLTGTGDNPATALLTGCLGQGAPVISMGTSGVLMIRPRRLEPEARGKAILFSPDGENFSCLVQGTLQSNGDVFKWWLRSILGIDDAAPVDSLLAGCPPPRNDLLFYPHLSGEKTIFADPDIRGAFIGLSTRTTREDMIYAVLEGLCCGYRELAENMRLDLKRCAGIKITGGGSRSTVQAQILANVLNVPVEQMDGTVSPALCAALLAAYHRGFIRSLDQISQGAAKIKAVIQPQAEMVEPCNRKYARYVKIYGALKTIYAEPSGT